MKVTYVVPRYGIEVIGGAEYGARMLAEHLVEDGVEVDVCTTCALDTRTWADAYPAARSELNGVTVHRYRSLRGRDPNFEEYSAKVLANPHAASTADERQWLDMQGPVCPKVLDGAAASRADVIVFYPYLYWPSVEGILRFGRHAVLHPATHDEPPIRLPIFRRVFSSAGGLVFQTAAERRMTEGFFPAVSAAPQAVVGLGVSTTEGSEPEARAAIGVGRREFLLCLGRVDEGKGSLLLYRFFVAYKQRHPGPLALVYVGPVNDPLPPHPDVFMAGTVDEQLKWGALRAAQVLVSPSPLESFSLVLLEAWSVGRPVLVNAACDATRRHVEASHGGLYFGSYATFEVALERLGAQPELRRAMGIAGMRYVNGRYTWPKLIARYRRFLQAVADRQMARGSASTSRDDVPQLGLEPRGPD